MGLSKVLKKFMMGRVFGTNKGRIQLFENIDFTLFPSRALALNLQKIGEDKSREYLWQLGYQAGKDAGGQFIGYMGIDPEGGMNSLSQVIKLLDFIGFGEVDIVKLDVQENEHNVVLHVKNNPVSEYGREIFGGDSLVCAWFAGVYTAHGRVEYGIENLKFREEKCITKGNEYCEFISKHPRED